MYYELQPLRIQAGWKYPSHDINGEYLLLLVKDEKWDHPLERITSKSKKEITDCIEKWVCHDFFAKYCNR